MPKISHPTSNDTCFLCGSQAFYISVNSKKLRCVEKITQCLGFISKAETSRKKNITTEERQLHMKKLSECGNAALKERHADPDWVSKKGIKIAEALVKRGGHCGENNPMHGKTHKDSSKNLQKQKAEKRSPNSYKQATETKISKGLATPKEDKTLWIIYQEQVTNYTNISWKYHQHLINPKNFERGSLYELDHKFSKFEGFKQGISPEIIGHYANLELILKKDNRSKRTKCSITLDKLYEAVCYSNVNNAPFSPSSLISI